MFFRIPEEFIFSVEERCDSDFLSDGYTRSSIEISDEFSDEYAEADEEYFESVKR